MVYASPSLLFSLIGKSLKVDLYLIRENASESLSVVSDSLQPRGLYSHWNSPGQNPEVDSLSLHQSLFPTQGSDPCLPNCR